MKISEAKDKLKIGMVVRTNGSDKTVWDFFEGVICRIEDSGFSVKRFDNRTGGGKYCEETGVGGYFVNLDNSRADIEILNDGKPQAIVSVPTKEDWIRVMKVALGNGLPDRYMTWDDSDCCLRIDSSNTGYCDKKWYQTNEPYRTKYAFITADEFVRDWGIKMEAMIMPEEIIAEIVINLKRSEDKPKNKSMLQTLTNALKRILPSNIQKQYRAGFRNGDLELTNEGIAELLDILAIEKEEELTKRAVEKIEEAEAKK